MVDDSGYVVIISEKRLGRLESYIASLLRAPMSVSRPLDEMNKKLWLLMDGENSLASIIIEMDQLFTEKMAPVAERVIASVGNFVELGYARLLDSNSHRDIRIALYSLLRLGTVGTRLYFLCKWPRSRSSMGLPRQERSSQPMQRYCR